MQYQSIQLSSFQPCPNDSTSLTPAAPSACRARADGYAPAPGFLAAQMAAMPELADPRMPGYDIHEYDPLLDSSNMRPADWVRIGQDIVAHYDAYDGFIVLHGTDTMAYTASALPFFLQGLRKPVIVTGSQIPLCEIRNDARANLITSMLIAAEYPVPEVCLYFGGKLLRGCRAVKVDADGLEAFDSPKYPAAGRRRGGDPDRPDLRSLRRSHHPGAAAGSRRWRRRASRSRRPAPRPRWARSGCFRAWRPICCGTCSSRRSRGWCSRRTAWATAPTGMPRSWRRWPRRPARGVVIVAITQCLRGAVHLGEYAAGSALAKAGVISGHDMTAEAALCKLFYLFSQGYSRGGGGREDGGGSLRRADRHRRGSGCAAHARPSANGQSPHPRLDGVMRPDT